MPDVAKKVYVESGEEGFSEGVFSGLPGTGEPVNYLRDSVADVSPVVAFQDMDGDGDRDIVVNVPGGGDSYWLENELGPDAEKLFANSIFQSIMPTTISWGELDGDGRMDVVVGHMGGAKAFLNDGKWSMADLGVSLSNPHVILLEDVDRDGQNDILIRDEREVVMVQNVEGALGAYSMAWPDLGTGATLAVGDVDLTNGSLEIMTLDSQGVLGMASHDGLRWQALQPAPELSLTSFEIADMNRDGLPDFVIEDSAGHRLWLEGDGTGNVDLHPVLDEEGIAAHVDPSLGADEAGAAEEPAPTPVGDQHVPPSVSKPPLVVDDGMAPERTGGGPHDSMMYSFRSIPVEPSPAERAFDYEAVPDIAFEADPDSTADYKTASQGMTIDLENGEAYSNNSLLGQLLFGNWFKWYSPDRWADTDSVVNVIGSGKGDLIYGNDSDNAVDAGEGADIVFGGDGEDVVLGSTGSDYLFGEKGDDSLYGGKASDYLNGGSGDDVLLGGQGGDYLCGRDGGDVLYGDVGSDTMYGGAGNDTFHYVTAAEGGDRVTRFDAAEDTFEFEFGSFALHRVEEGYDGTCDGEGDSFIWESVEPGRGNLYYDADVADSGNETLIATVILDDADDAMTIDNIDIL